MDYHSFSYGGVYDFKKIFKCCVDLAAAAAGVSSWVPGDDIIKIVCGEGD